MPAIAGHVNFLVDLVIKLQNGCSEIFEGQSYQRNELGGCIAKMAAWMSHYWTAEIIDSKTSHYWTAEITDSKN